MSTFGSLREKMRLSCAFSRWRNFSIDILLSSSMESELMWTSTLLRVLMAGHLTLNSSIISFQTNKLSLVSSSTLSLVCFWKR